MILVYDGLMRRFRSSIISSANKLDRAFGVEPVRRSMNELSQEATTTPNIRSVF
jgi:hypothetical protein